MFAQKRHRLILDSLQKHSPLTIPELEKQLKASPATVRRDLAFLENLGKVVRTHGAVLHPDRVDRELSFDRKRRAALTAKIAMAEVAIGLVEKGDTVFIDAGSTTFEVGKRLLQQEELTVFTNSIPLLNESPGQGCRLISIGGEVRSVSLALVGSEAFEWTKRLRFDVAFLGTSGIDPAEGPTTTELAEAGIKSAAVSSAARVVVLADASKWNQPASIRYAGWSRIHDFVTDYTPTRAERGALAGTRLHRVNLNKLK